MMEPNKGVYKMGAIRGLFITLILLASNPVWAINYYRCDQASDCTKAYGGCGRYFSVHKRYKELYEAKAHKGDRVSFCKAPTENDNLYKYQGRSVCRKQRCLLSLPKKEQKSS